MNCAPYFQVNSPQCFGNVKLHVYLRNSSKATCESESNGRKGKPDDKKDDGVTRTAPRKTHKEWNTSIVKGHDGHADLRGRGTGPPTGHSTFFSSFSDCGLRYAEGISKPKTRAAFVKSGWTIRHYRRWLFDATTWIEIYGYNNLWIHASQFLFDLQRFLRICCGFAIEEAAVTYIITFDVIVRGYDAWAFSAGTWPALFKYGTAIQRTKIASL